MVLGAVVDAAIGWLVQSILGNLFTDKLEAWTRRVGLGGEVEKLKSDMRYVQMVLAAAKGRKIESEPLVQSLADLKERLYDAEDVMDELEYYRLEEQVTSGTAGTGSATIIDPHKDATSSRWSFFSLLGKRKLEDYQNIVSNRQIGNKSELSQRIKDIAGELRNLGSDVSEALSIDRSNFATGTSNLNHSTPQDTRLTSPYLVDQVYGRNAEKESILKLIASNSPGITVLPIVGMGGIGKTTLAQSVYNDPIVKSQFQIMIWVCVSNNFDVTRLTKEMLDYVYDQRSAETGNLNKLQIDLQKHMKSRRFLIILDDIWDDMKEHSWKQLLAPLKCNQQMGNMILLTTRELVVAEMTKTVQPIKLNAMERDDFWVLFKAYAFDHENQEEHDSLYSVGKQIAQELSGNPLAAKTVGTLLRRKNSIDHWTDVLNNEEWKSLKDCTGIMPALKLSYDYMPDHLQQCFRYCCLFPKDYHFDGAELVRIWISQGFVHGWHSGKNLEDIGKDYLAELVNSGFFQQVERHWDSSTRIVMHDLMHDLAWGLSRADFMIIDGTKCEKILPTVRHLSIVNGSTSSLGNFEKCLMQLTLQKLRSVVVVGSYEPTLFNLFQNMFKQTENLRLLQISTTYADFISFLSNLVNCTHLRYLKLLEVRYCQIVNTVGDEASPVPLSKFYHLEVLDAGHPTTVHGINDLVSMRYLYVINGPESSITSCSQLTQLQLMNNLVELGVSQLQNVSREEACAAKLKDKLQLVRLHLSWHILRDTLSMDESEDESLEYDIDSDSQDEYGSDSPDEYAIDTFSESEDESLEGDIDTFSESEDEYAKKQVESSQTMDDPNNIPTSEHFVNTESDGYARNPGSQHFIDAQTEEESSLPPNDCNNPNSEAFIDAKTDDEVFVDAQTELESLSTSDSNINSVCEHCVDTRDVLECLEPHHNLKHLWVSGYSGATFPTWLGTSVTCLRTLHLEDCEKWQTLPYLGRLSLLTNLKLMKMQTVKEVWVPSSLEELVLIGMPELKKCSCSSVRGLNSRLTTLEIVRCPVLEDFPLFESCEKLKIEHNSWLPRLNKLTMNRCGLLKVSNPLPPSSEACELAIARVPAVPTMKRATNGELMIRGKKYKGGNFLDKYNYMTELDDSLLSFHNLRALTHLNITRCRSISLEGFRQLISLKRLEIHECNDLFSSEVVPEHAREDMPADANFIALPNLKHLLIKECGITGKWLSMMLRHAPALEELDLKTCHKISQLLIEGKERSRSISLEGFRQLISLKRLEIHGCNDLFSSEVLPEHAREDMPADANFIALPNLKHLLIKECGITGKWLSMMLRHAPALEELDLNTCHKISQLLIEGKERSLSTHNSSPRILSPGIPDDASTSSTLDTDGQLRIPSNSIPTLKKMNIEFCKELTFEGNEEGFAGFTSLQGLSVWGCPKLISSLVDKRNGTWILPRSLGYLRIHHSPETLHPCFPEDGNNCLKMLQIVHCPSLKSLQLQSCTALEKLMVVKCDQLDALDDFQSLSVLRHLEVSGSPGVRTCLEHLLSQGYELCPRLECLEIDDYSFLTRSFCKCLTSLKRLVFHSFPRGEITRLTDGQEEALQLLTSLQELFFSNCNDLADLPVGLHSLLSLKILELLNCQHILRLPDMGLPPSLEKLKLSICRWELTEQCTKLETSTLKVEIWGI